ncbi:MAG TPA: Rieske 2Fe-2S domain-containing protein [Steroidobacteraceae bacterium]|nr:Rieske 2Fe-2S domain-containing protein [Steroidobacteraceae bacterium]
MTRSVDVERVVCALADLADPGSRAFTIGRGDWPLRGFVVRRGSAVHAYVNCCPHADHPLNLRPHEFLSPDGSLVLCNSHGALFEITTGLCVAGPCAGARLQRVPVEVTGGYVLVAADFPVADWDESTGWR